MNNLLDNIKNINTFVDFISKIKKRSIEKKISIIAEIIPKICNVSGVLNGKSG